MTKDAGLINSPDYQDKIYEFDSEDIEKSLKEFLFNHLNL
jgi:hypothetical protein